MRTLPVVIAVAGLLMASAFAQPDASVPAPVADAGTSPPGDPELVENLELLLLLEDVKDLDVALELESR